MNYRVKEKITMADLSFRVQHVTKTEVDVTQAQLSRNEVDVDRIGQLYRFLARSSCELARTSRLRSEGHNHSNRDQALFLPDSSA
jgi:hypothetical protein